jgi:two-component system sensor histidine kinase/response regulator
MKNVVNDFIDYSQLQTNGEIHIITRKVKVRKIINEIIRILKYQVKSRRTRLTCQIDDNVPKFWNLDPVRIQQILFNLILNALKFTSHGNVDVKITRDYDKLKFQVLDQGNYKLLIDRSRNF